MTTAGRIGVLVVDDSVVVRRLVTTVLTSDAEIDVVGTASSGRLALDKIGQLSPDLVTLDIEMPGMDGLQTLREIRRLHPKLPVVMFSSLTERGAAATLDALTFGANDYVTKPSSVTTPGEALENVRAQLIPKIKALVADRGLDRADSAGQPVAPAASRRAVPRTVVEPSGGVDVVAIGASTGGPDALSSVLSRLPAEFPLPVVVVQHMPALFTRLFAQRLDQVCAMTVHEARPDMVLEPGTVYLAPGDYHLSVRRENGVVRTHIDQDGPENWVRPAVDVLFRSVADVFGARALALVLTGMGQDGLRGCKQLSAAGAQIAVQDEATSVVWGMPGSVATNGLAHRVLPLGETAAHIVNVAGRGRCAALARAGARTEACA